MKRFRGQRLSHQFDPSASLSLRNAVPDAASTVQNATTALEAKTLRFVEYVL